MTIVQYRGCNALIHGSYSEARRRPRTGARNGPRRGSASSAPGPGGPVERAIRTAPLRNPVLYRLHLPVCVRAAELQRAADPGGVPDDEAAALFVVEDEQGKPG